MRRKNSNAFEDFYVAAQKRHRKDWMFKILECRGNVSNIL